MSAADYDAQGETVDGLRELLGLPYESARGWDESGAMTVELAKSSRAAVRRRFTVSPCGAVAEALGESRTV